MNELIFIGTVLIYLGSVLLLYKLFGKNGLFDFAIFVTFAFWGTYPVGVLMSILITTYVYEKLTKCLVNSVN